MKTPRIHCLRRSVAYSATAAVIVLAAALTSAAPAAADGPAPHEGAVHQERCETSVVKQNQGLEELLLALLPGNMEAMKHEDQCAAKPDGQSEGGRSWFDGGQKAGADHAMPDGARSEEPARER
ncbi:hypothetical protein [Streptomyces sp. NPDC020298]|uniref:hypothetical protein n=1 Tax=unclassified Streptomyces TaxID=2593676 RepID=UPI0034034C82